MKKIIYADNAATTKLDKNAFEAMKTYLLDEYGNPSQPYSFSRKPKKTLQTARQIIAKCINAEPGEIYFTSGGTESDNWAIKGVNFIFPEKKVTITSQIEHHAILNACKDIEKLGYPVVYLSVEKSGKVNVEEFEEFITDSTGLVSIMMANNEIGTIQDICRLSKIAHKHGALFHTDAVQAIGHIHIDVKELGVDLLSASAHKFGGPKGIGFLYIKSGINISPLISGGSQEFSLRAGTENVAAIVGMAEALNQAVICREKIEFQLRKMEKIFLQILKDNNIDFIQNGDLYESLPGLINISIRNANGEMILHRLDLMGYIISTGSACDGNEDKVSHVIEAIRVDNNYKEGTIRISFGKYNDVSDAEELALAIVKILKQY